MQSITLLSLHWNYDISYDDEKNDILFQEIVYKS